MEKEKEINEEREKINIEDLTIPQIKKVVHLIMTKFYGLNGYRQSDLVRKMLRKLKCDYSPKAAARVRNQLKNWIISNNEIIKKGNIDSKKGFFSCDSKKEILKSQKKKKYNLRSRNDTVDDQESSRNNINDVNGKSNNLNNVTKESDKSVNTKKQCEIDETDQLDNSKKNQVENKEKKQVECSCKRKRNSPNVVIKHELIDLTIDDDPVKIEIDDDMYDINAVISKLDDYYTQTSFLYLCCI